MFIGIAFVLIYFLTFNTYKYVFPLFPLYSFDNDDMKSSKRHAVLLSLIFLLKCRFCFIKSSSEDWLRISENFATCIQSLLLGVKDCQRLLQVMKIATVKHGAIL